MGIGLAGTVRSVAKDFNAVASSGRVNGANEAAKSDLRNRNPNDYKIWHDGSCTGSGALDCAIRKHLGEGSNARNAYMNASTQAKNQLLQFLRDI